MAAGEQKQPPARERSRLFSAGAAYALFGFATAAVSFVFLVDPALRPDPRENQIASISTAATVLGAFQAVSSASAIQEGPAS